jgi:hypothetical protein
MLASLASLAFVLIGFGRKRRSSWNWLIDRDALLMLVTPFADPIIARCSDVLIDEGREIVLGNCGVASKAAPELRPTIPARMTAADERTACCTA